MRICLSKLRVYARNLLTPCVCRNRLQPQPCVKGRTNLQNQHEGLKNDYNRANMDIALEIEPKVWFGLLEVFLENNYLLYFCLFNMEQSGWIMDS